MKLQGPRHGTVVAYIALFTALGGGAYAAATLPKNSVTSKTIKDGSIRARDVKRDTLSGDQIDESKLDGLVQSPEPTTVFVKRGLTHADASSRFDIVPGPDGKGTFGRFVINCSPPNVPSAFAYVNTTTQAMETWTTRGSGDATHTRHQLLAPGDSLFLADVNDMTQLMVGDAAGGADDLVVAHVALSEADFNCDFAIAATVYTGPQQGEG